MVFKVIADLYERYVELIGTPIDEEGNTMPDGCVQEPSNGVTDMLMCFSNERSRTNKQFAVMLWMSLA